MQEMMEVRLKDEIVHVNNDWMESNVCTEKASLLLEAQLKIKIIRFP